MAGRARMKSRRLFGCRFDLNIYDSALFLNLNLFVRFTSMSAYCAKASDGTMVAQAHSNEATNRETRVFNGLG